MIAYAHGVMLATRASSALCPHGLVRRVLRLLMLSLSIITNITPLGRFDLVLPRGGAKEHHEKVRSAIGWEEG